MDAQRIPFTARDERRIASVATWGMIVASSSLVMALVALVAIIVLYFAGTHLRFAFGPFFVVGAIQASLVVLLNLWLLQASLAFRKVATTDEADQAYLLAGFRKLRAYFMLQVILVLIAVGFATLIVMLGVVL